MRKLIVNYADEYKVEEIKDTIFFYKRKPCGGWQMDRMLDVTLEDLFNCGKDKTIIVLMKFYQDLFLGSVEGVGSDSGYVCPKTKEVFLNAKETTFMRVEFDDTGVYYDKNGKIINFKKYLG